MSLRKQQNDTAAESCESSGSSLEERTLKELNPLGLFIRDLHWFAGISSAVVSLPQEEEKREECNNSPGTQRKRRLKTQPLTFLELRLCNMSLPIV